MSISKDFETLTFASPNDASVFAELRSLLKQSDIKVVDIRRNGTSLIVVFRRLPANSSAARADKNSFPKGGTSPSD